MDKSLFKEGDILLCIKDFKMTAGSVAFTKGKKYIIKSRHKMLGYYDYVMDSDLYGNHTMPDTDLPKYFSKVGENEVDERVYKILHRLMLGAWEVHKSKLGDFRQCHFCCVSPYSEHKEDCPVRLAREVMNEGD